VGGKILFHGQDLLELDDKEMQSLRGSKISMIFQEPSTALDPVMTVGKQVSEALRIHKGLKKKEAMQEAVELLRRVRIPNPEQRAKQYPFEFSGGMQQRAMIAMAIACNPEVLIADEPTTALDVTVQAQVLEELDELRRENDMALILITHNLGVVARYAESVKIVYGGRIVESGTPYDIFENPYHPYTLGLIRAVPRLDLPNSYGLHAIEGSPPDMSKVPKDCCAFAPRCKYATEQCSCQRPEEEEIAPGHFCACFHKDQTEEERGQLQ
jgi:oligopeptide/dipeptide ABC transporter ATP-binding protein